MTEPDKHRCEVCGKTFARAHTKNLHALSKHSDSMLEGLVCGVCHAQFTSLAAIRAHRLNHGDETGEFVEYKSAFRQACVTFRRYHGPDCASIEQVFLSDNEDMRAILTSQIEIKRTVKCACIVYCVYIHMDADQEHVDNTMEMAHRCPTVKLLHKTAISEFIEYAKNDIVVRHEDFTNNGSGW